MAAKNQSIPIVVNNGGNVMESKLINKPWGWEYVSKNGIEYLVGEVTADFNVVIDDFNDINELFDCEAIILAKPIDYVYGDLEREFGARGGIVFYNRFDKFYC